jgi:hypothetical protein
VNSPGGGHVDICLVLIVSVSQTTSFLTNKVPVAGVTGVVVAPSFSLTQVAPLPGCVHPFFLYQPF